MSRISNPTTGLEVRRVGLVLWTESVTEGSLMPKNCLMYVPLPCLSGLGALVLSIVRVFLSLLPMNKYSQLRRAKKRAPESNWLLALALG